MNKFNLALGRVISYTVGFYAGMTRDMSLLVIGVAVTAVIYIISTMLTRNARVADFK